MEKVVPGALQRLRAADIIRIAGLASASLGQEYNRTAIIHNKQRQGVRLRGIITISQATTDSFALDLEELTGEVLIEQGDAVPVCAVHVYPVDVEVMSSTSWICTCSCSADQDPRSSICAHAAALLYRWLSQPSSFEVLPTPVQSTPATSTRAQKASKQSSTQEILTVPVVVRYDADLTNILSQLGLGELRGIAREYGLTHNGVAKQQIVDTIIEAVRQPDSVRRVAATLEKEQRQLLAALILAGDALNDDDLRGLFERFKLGQPPQLQRVLLILQSKGMLFRTNSLGNGSHQHRSTGGSWLDIGWFVPTEVRNALRVSVPISLFDVEHPAEKYGRVHIETSEPYQVLEDLLLVACALIGYHVTSNDRWLPDVSARAGLPSAATLTVPTATVHNVQTEQAMSLPCPDDIPSEAVVSVLRKKVPRTPAFLRWAVRVLALAGFIQRDERDVSRLQVLPEAAQILLGSAPERVLHDLFQLWLRHASYGELFELTQEGIQIHTRTTSLNIPVLRQGEIEEENREARQALLALLALTPRNEWVNFQGFVNFVYRLTPLFLQRHQRLYMNTNTPPHWWFENEAGHPLKPLRFGDWQLAELPYIKHLLRGPLFWWGACDLAFSAQNQLLAFRLNTRTDTLLAEYLVPPMTSLDRATDEPTSRGEAGSVQIAPLNENAVMVPCQRSAWPAIDVLEGCTEAYGVCDERLVYRLTPQCFGAALSRGDRRARELLTVLRSATAAATEQEAERRLVALSALVEQWLASYGRVRIYTGVAMLEVSDTNVLREIAAYTDLKAQIVQQLQPTMHLIKKDAVKSLIDDIKRHGQSPLVHEEDSYGTE